MMKKIAACLLALLLTVSVLPVSAENTAGETSGSKHKRQRFYPLPLTYYLKDFLQIIIKRQMP